MSNRSANSVIKGYFYQFDYTIFKLLSFSNLSHKAVVEGIEDIDIVTATDTTAFQCKYYEDTEYNHSIIKDPIKHMLTHYSTVKNSGQKVKYKIYGYYQKGQLKLPAKIDLAFLKSNFLTYSKFEKDSKGKKVKKTFKHHKDLGLNDADLLDFISLLDIDINAKEFNKQYEEIISNFVSLYSCSEFEAKYFYYNNALKAIKDISIQKKVADREISKKEFLDIIDKKEVLFDIWLLQLTNEQKHFKALKNEYFTNLNTSPFERFFLIEHTSGTARSDLKEITYLIIKKWSKMSSRGDCFCPYIYFHNIVKNELVELKKELQNDTSVFIDGFDFEGADFNLNSILKPATFANKIRVKFINEEKQLNQILSSISQTKEIYQFYIDKKPFFDFSADIKHIKIQVGKINNIKMIL